MSFTLHLALSLLLAVQALLLAGCSGYTEARMPSDLEGDRPVVEEGVEARVYLYSGEVHEGEVTRVTPDSITLGKPGNHGFEETEFAMREIREVTVFEGSEAEETAGLLAGAGMLIVLVPLVVLGIAWAGTSWN